MEKAMPAFAHLSATSDLYNIFCTTSGRAAEEVMAVVVVMRNQPLQCLKAGCSFGEHPLNPKRMNDVARKILKDFVAPPSVMISVLQTTILV